MNGLTRRSVIAAGSAAAVQSIRAQSKRGRPNILWVLGDDLGVELSCYGHPIVHTPNIDRLAGEGVRFANAHTTAPVCSASRSAFNTGVYQTTTGTHNHRSHRKDGYRLPGGARLITDVFREAGYFTANVREIAPGVQGSGKTDFNFVAEKPFDGTHWSQRPEGKPFFAQINFQAPHKGPAFKQARRRSPLVDPAKVQLPPYYPDDPVVRDEVANYYDAIHLLDSQVGEVWKALERDGLWDNTIVFFFGDNGRCLLRGKQWLYEPGTHVPLLVRWPGSIRPGTVRDDLVSAVDIAASSLEAAGIPVDFPMDGQPLFSGKTPRPYVITARDRCDMTVDRIRAVRDRRYRLIHNFMPERPYTQWNEYIEQNYPTLRILQEWHKAGKLNPVQSRFLAPRRPEIELYDLTSDPYEVNNLAGKPEHAKEQARLNSILDGWIQRTDDKGRIRETREQILEAEPRASDPRTTQ